VLIVNITGKDVDAFRCLVEEIERSKTERVLFVSSTSVYAADAGEVAERDGREIPGHPLLPVH
jgi:nucleoside-diphosphate-sugar epimerase